MSANAMERPSGNGLRLRSVDRPGHAEHCLTLDVGAEPESGRSPEALFNRVAEVLAERKIERIQEKMYGRTVAHGALLETRRAVYGRAGVPLDNDVVFIDGASPDGGDFAGLQIWGLSTDQALTPLIETLPIPQVGAARAWTTASCRWIYVPAVRGTDAGGALATDEEQQGAAMFANAAEALQLVGATYKNVVRTWIYLPRILGWYDGLNRVRTTHHQAHGLLTGSPADRFPASTGIQGRGLLGEACFMDLLALAPTEGSQLQVRHLQRSPRQDQAFSYGSGFARGVCTDLAGHKTILISGTAAIDAQGRSKYLDDPEAQCLDTLMNIAALLEDEGASLDDVAMATVFCKTPQTRRAYDEVTRLLSCPTLPAVFVQADVCRPELLVEIEAVALL